MSAFEVIPLDHMGAEISGLDIQGMTDEVKRDLYATWLDYGVLLFREAAADPETHVKLAKVFGDLEIHPVKSLLVPGNDELIFLGGHGKNSGGARASWTGTFGSVRSTGIRIRPTRRTSAGDRCFG